jgi:ABC-type Fe3+-hydroxamate transport system substrate-binding protein
MRVTPLVITAALLFASACAGSESSVVATATTTSAATSTTAASTDTAPADTTTTEPPSTTTTTDVGCADPPVCFYAAGENVCSVDGNPPCADDPRNIYVNETIGFSFALDEDWRRLGTDTDGRIQLVDEYFAPGDPFIVVSWEPTMGRTLDMFHDELVASSDPDVIRSGTGRPTSWAVSTGSRLTGLFLNAMSVPFTPTRTRGRRSSSSPSARAWRSARKPTETTLQIRSGPRSSG